MAEEATLVETPVAVEPAPEPSPAPVSMDNADAVLETIQKGYEKAVKENRDPSTIDNMSPEELQEFLGAPIPDAQPAPATQTPSESTAPPTLEKAPVESPELVTLKQQHANLQALYGRQANEIGQVRQENTQFRQTIETVNPLLERLNTDPGFRQHVLSYDGRGTTQPETLDIPSDYDPYNPAHVDALVTKKVNQRLQAERQAAIEADRRTQAATLVSTFNSNVQAETQRLVNAGLPPDMVQTAVQKISRAFQTGNFVELAVKLENLDSLIAAAEKRGTEKAHAETAKRIQDAASIPNRTAATGAQQSGKSIDTTKSHTECKTPEQLFALCDRLKPDSPRWRAAVDYGAKQGWKEFM